jgi:hypothetical protein
MAGVKPSAGSEMVVSYERIYFTYEVAWGEDLPDARVWIELLDASGKVCDIGHSDPFILTSNQLARVDLAVILIPTTFECGLPSETRFVRASLLTLRPIGDGTYLTRTTYLTTQVEAPFRFRRYPRPPEGVGQAAPAITDLKWHSNVPTCGRCFPLYDEVLFITCTARAADGDALTSDISIVWSDGRTASGTREFPAGASSSDEGASFVLNSVNRAPSSQAVSATAVCTVTNSRGETATQTLIAGR